MNHWISLVVDCSPTETETVAMLLQECGACGTQIDDTDVAFDESEDATLTPRLHPQVRGYFEVGGEGSPGSKEQLVVALAEVCRNALVSVCPGATLAVAPVADEDWATSWRQNFPPLPIGRFLIVPTWESEVPNESGAIAILLDPGLAFGTGQHPTTFLCLTLLGETMPKLAASGEKPRVLDVGCGSGILSIAAAKLGARVVASDLDTFCTAASIENAALNDVEVDVVLAAGAAWTEETFDLVVANLMSDLLIRLAGELYARARPGGTLIVSGISSPRADEVALALTATGFEIFEKRERDGDLRGDHLERWAAFVAVRPDTIARNS